MRADAAIRNPQGADENTVPAYGADTPALISCWGPHGCGWLQGFDLGSVLVKGGQ